MSCNGEHNHKHEDVDIINLTLEDGSSLKCEVIVVFEVDSKDYIVLLPEKGENVFLYEYGETEEGPKLSIIKDDREYEKISEIYNNMQEGE